MLDETRSQLQTSKNQHMRQIVSMESEELIAQKKVRSEMIQMEDVLAQIRKEYETLRIEFEQNMAANEQTAPINREMRHLITSLQNHNGQLKGEVFRYKRKYKDSAAELMKLKKEFDDLVAKANMSDAKKVDIKQEGAVIGIKEESSSDGSVSIKEEAGSLIKGMSCSTLNISQNNFVLFQSAESDPNEDELEEIDNIKKEGNLCVKQEKGVFASSTADKMKDGQTNVPKIEKDLKEAQRVKEMKVNDSEMVRDLKTQLK